MEKIMRNFVRMALIVAMYFCSQISLSDANDLKSVRDAHQRFSDEILSRGGYRIVTSEIDPQNGRRIERKKLVSLTGDNYLFENRRIGYDTFANSVNAVSDEYCFQLKCVGGNPWTLGRYALSDSKDVDMKRLGFDVEYRRPSQMMENAVLYPSLRGIASNQLSIPALMKDNRIRNPTVVQKTNEVITIKFQRKLYQGVANNSPLSDQWSDVKITFQNVAPMLPILLEEQVATLSLISEIEWTTKQNGDHDVRQAIKEMNGSETTMLEVKQSLIVGAPSKSDFLLSAYGFAEPSELNNKRSPSWYLWLFCGGALLIGLAIFLKVKSSKPS
jgi:hypothetical protein